MSKLGGALLLLLGSLATGCEEGTPEEMMMTNEPDLTPEKIFDREVKAGIVMECAICHKNDQGTSVKAFLTEGMEYAAITAYTGGEFVTPMSAPMSPLLIKGAHSGPALSQELYGKIQKWIEAEIVFRPGPMGTNKSALLPTAPLTPGDFNMSMEKIEPILDAGANVTFTLAKDNNNIYRVTKLSLTAGALTGIRAVHPIMYFISGKTASPDPSDAFSAVDMNVASGMTSLIGSGNVLLVNAPSQDPNTRIGIAFTQLLRVNVTNTMVMCKNLAMFNTLRPLMNPCAMMCHAGNNQGAASAWNMQQQNSTDPAVQAQFCISALGRLNKNDVAASIGLRNPLPPPVGLQNHGIYKLPAAQQQPYQTAWTNWGNGEK